MKLKRKEEVPAQGLASRLSNLQNGRDEMNLCELPFATLSERSGGRNMLRFEVEDYDAELRQTVRRTLTCSLPGSTSPACRSTESR